MKKTKIISLLLSFLLIIAPLSSAFITVKAADEVVWTFDKVTGTLTISGVGETGTIDDKAPLGCGKKDVKVIKIKDGITKVSDKAFVGYTELKAVSFPLTLTEIGTSSFFTCKNLKNVEIPISVTKIGASAFQSCSGLDSILIPDSVTSIAANAFNNCNSMSMFCIKGSFAYNFAQTRYIPRLVLIKQTDENTGISVTYEEVGTFDGEAKLNVSENSSNSVTLPENYEKVSVFDIGFTVDDIKTEPQKEITINVPVPDDFDLNTFKVFTENDFGELEETKITYYNGIIIFKTAKPGTVVLADSIKVESEEKEQSLLYRILNLFITFFEFIYVLCSNFAKL